MYPDVLLVIDGAWTPESGLISINEHGLVLPEVPFGGVKDSGYGSEAGSEAIENYLDSKLVTQACL